jgi:hypothetical protein
MFKWLRDKMLTGSEGEFRKCIDMCHTFIKFAEEQEMLNPTPIDIGAKFDYPNISTKLNYMSDQLAGLSSDGYSPETMSKLLDLDMECRRLWAIAYGQKDLKYNKTFEPK